MSYIFDLEFVAEEFECMHGISWQTNCGALHSSVSSFVNEAHVTRGSNSICHGNSTKPRSDDKNPRSQSFMMRRQVRTVHNGLLIGFTNTFNVHLGCLFSN